VKAPKLYFLVLRKPLEGVIHQNGGINQEKKNKTGDPIQER
jgi:hypothetical protein